MPLYSAPQLPLSAPLSVPVALAQETASVEAAGPTELPGITITAPMVGTFYGAPSPKDPPYVRVGDEVKPGDVLGIIEAMKNEIECEVHGRITQVLAQSSQPVEYGQALMVVEPL